MKLTQNSEEKIWSGIELDGGGGGGRILGTKILRLGGGRGGEEGWIRRSACR